MQSLWPIVSIWFFAVGDSVVVEHLFQLQAAVMTGSMVFLAGATYRLGRSRWLTIATIAFVLRVAFAFGIAVAAGLGAGHASALDLVALIQYSDHLFVLVGVLGIAVASGHRIGLGAVGVTILSTALQLLGEPIAAWSGAVPYVATMAAWQLVWAALMIATAARVVRRVPIRPFDPAVVQRRVARLPVGFAGFAIAAGVSALPIGLAGLALRELSLLVIVILAWPVALAQWPQLPRYALSIATLLAITAIARELASASFEVGGTFNPVFAEGFAWWTDVPFMVATIALASRRPPWLVVIVGLTVAAYLSRNQPAIARVEIAGIAGAAIPVMRGIARAFTAGVAKTTADVFA